MANVNSKQEYAPGVTVDYESDTCIRYVGKSTALVASGLVQQYWLPGELGNGKTSQSLIFLVDGTVQLLKPKSHFKSFDLGFGGIKTWKSGSLFYVNLIFTKDESNRRMAVSDAKKEQETWQLAKQAHQQPDFPERWKNGVLYHVDQAEKLIEGKLVFTDFPDIGIPPSGVEAAKRAIAELKDVLRWIAPQVKDKVKKSNVYYLNESAFRSMKRG